MSLPVKGTQRVRHPLRLRVLEVAEVRAITPRMVRVALVGPDLEDFTSLAYDDHVKVFFPHPGKPVPVPVVSENGLAFPEGQRPPARDYTPRRFSAQALEIDFVLHGDGPASTWAAQARPGQMLAVGGPRGSFVVSNDFDWYLLAGDETALPAIGRRLEELPAGAKAIAVIEVADAAEEQAFALKADARITWLHRNGAEPGTTTLLADAIGALALPPGDGYCFVAAEANAAKAVRSLLVERFGHNPDWVKAAGYWQRLSADFDDGHAH